MGKELLTFNSNEILKKFLNKISCGERNYKYFIGYLYNDH